MRDRIIVRLGLLLLAASALACNASLGGEQPALPSPPAAPSLGAPAPATGGGTAAPGLAPTATLPGEATAATPQGTLHVLADLNVRAGPGVGYERVGFLLRDETAAILGRDPASGWWKISCPPRAEGDECWVSGSAQYTRAENADAAPPADVPATPTPAPPDPAPGTGLLIVIDGGRLYALTLDLTQDPPIAAPPLLLSEAPAVQRAAVAPDGRAVAFTVLDATTGHNELRVVNADGGNERVLARAAELPRVPEATELPAAAGDEARVQVLDFRWRSDGQSLVFNTALIGPEGFAAGSQSDLWAAGPDGPPTELLAAGRGLPRFALSPADRLLLIGRQEILRAAGDGRGLESALTFAPWPAVESLVYPAAQWRADGAAALVAVAEAPGDAAAAPEERSVALWRVPAAGAAEALGRLQADALAAPPLWSPGGERLAFLRTLPDGPELWLANGDGSRPERVATGRELRPLAWRGTTLLFAGPDYAAVVSTGQATVIARAAGGQIGQGVWLSDTAIALALDGDDGPALFAVRGDGTRQLLAPLLSAGAALDVWLP